MLYKLNLLEDRWVALYKLNLLVGVLTPERQHEHHILLFFCVVLTKENDLQVRVSIGPHHHKLANLSKPSLGVAILDPTCQPDPDSIA